MRAALPVTLLVAFLILAVFPAGPPGVADAGTGTPTFVQYAAPSSLPNVNFAGEPSLGVNWNTGAVMYQSYESTYKVVFNDATVPATATWTDVDSNNVVNIDP